MPRKFDKYGWNRQFKWQPVSKPHPFPYRLPFVDDYSVPAALHKASISDNFSDMSEDSVNSPDILDKDEYFKMVQRRRNRTKQFRELHGGLLPPPKRARTSHGHSTLKALAAGAAVVGTAAGVIFAPEIGLPAACTEARGAAARTVVRRMELFVKARIRDLNRRGLFDEAGQLWKDYKWLQRGGISGRHVIRFLRKNGFKAGFNFSKGLHLSLGV